MACLRGFDTIRLPCLGERDPSKKLNSPVGDCTSQKGNINYPTACNMPLAPLVEFKQDSEEACNSNECAWTIIGTCSSQRFAPLLQYSANTDERCDQGKCTSILARIGGCSDSISQNTLCSKKPCKTNRCRPEAFYFPHISIARTKERNFYLLARPVVTPVVQSQGPCFSRIFCAPTGKKFEYAVSALPNCTRLIRLSEQPTQVPGQCATTNGFYESAFLQIRDGDQIYIPGQFGSFRVQLFADALAGPYRASASVMRGYSPIGRLPGRVFTSNSGLRNFNALPSTAGLLRPW